MYAAGLGTLRLTLLLPAILLGRATGILFGAFAGNATAVLPAQFVIVQWLFLLALAAFIYRFQRPVRYHLFVGIRRLRRLSRRRGTLVGLAAVRRWIAAAPYGVASACS